MHANEQPIVLALESFDKRGVHDALAEAGTRILIVRRPHGEIVAALLSHRRFTQMMRPLVTGTQTFTDLTPQDLATDGLAAVARRLGDTIGVIHGSKGPFVVVLPSKPFRAINNRLRQAAGTSV